MQIKKLLILMLLLIFSTVNKSISSQTTATHEANTNPLGIRLMRQVPREYIPGGMMEIVLNIYCDAPDPNYPVTAIGLYEMLPSDWTFVSMRGINTDPPPIAPAPGTTGTLQFAWITPPPFPCSFAYTVQIPEGASGVKIISGQVEYRTNGPRLVSSPEVTEINGVDRTPPTITLLGDNPLTLTQGTPYVEPGWKAEDNADGDITARVQTSGYVNINVPGEYTITYTVRDNAGNNASAVRTVKVIPKQTPTTPTTPNTPTVPITGPVVVPPPIPPSTLPTPTTTNRPPTTPPMPPKPGSTQVAQVLKPEEVTFPRPEGIPSPPPIPPQKSKPKGIASGEELKPFKIPKEIKSGFSLPANFEKNKVPTELPPNKREPKTKESKPTESSQSTEEKLSTTSTTTSIESQIQISPSPTTVQTAVASAQPESTPAENTASLPVATTTPPEGRKPLLYFISNLYKWWENKSNAEKRNLIGMGIVSLLLTILCIITGINAYQGVSPQPRRRKTTSQPLANSK